MPARIYALAKELNLDSKDLVDLVKKVGITGKGSALASLTDEETQRVRDHLGGAVKPPEPSAAPAAVRDAVPKERKPISIQVGRASNRPQKKELPTPDVAAKAPEPERLPPAEPSQPVEADVPATSAKVPSLASRIASRIGSRNRASDSSAPIRQDNLSTNSGKVRSLDRPTAGTGERKGADKAKRREPRINVKMASLPETGPPSPRQPVAGEPKAQKPDIKLSKDVIAGHKQGMKAPLEQLAKEDTEKKREGKRAAGGLSGFTGDKSKRGKVSVKEEEEKPRKKGIAAMASARAERTRGKRRQFFDRSTAVLRRSFGSFAACTAKKGCQHRGTSQRFDRVGTSLHDSQFFRSRRRTGCTGAACPDGHANDGQHQLPTRPRNGRVDCGRTRSEH